MIGIVQNHKLWATDYRHLNDRKEYRIGLKLIQEQLSTLSLNERQRRMFDMLVAQTQKGYFVLSFSERGDQLSQWRAYSPGGNGYALGFGQKNALFASAKQHSFNLIRCEYDPSKQRKLCRLLIDSFMEGMVSEQSWLPGSDTPSRAKAFFKRYQWNLSLALVISALKHSGFEEEREWRLVSQYPDEALYGVSFRPGRFGVTPYFELPIDMGESPHQIDEIIIGPTSNRAASNTALEILLSKNETTAGKIKLSSTPLRQ